MTRLDFFKLFTKGTVAAAAATALPAAPKAEPAPESSIVVVSNYGPGFTTMQKAEAEKEHRIILAGPFKDYREAEREADKQTTAQALYVQERINQAFGRAF